VAFSSEHVEVRLHANLSRIRFKLLQRNIGNCKGLPEAYVFDAFIFLIVEHADDTIGKRTCADVFPRSALDGEVVEKVEYSNEVTRIGIFCNHTEEAVLRSVKACAVVGDVVCCLV